jgi:hypothetical protein
MVPNHKKFNLLLTLKYGLIWKDIATVQKLIVPSSDAQVKYVLVSAVKIASADTFSESETKFIWYW